MVVLQMRCLPTRKYSCKSAIIHFPNLDLSGFVDSTNLDFICGLSTNLDFWKSRSVIERFRCPNLTPILWCLLRTSRSTSLVIPVVNNTNWSYTVYVISMQICGLSTIIYGYPQLFVDIHKYPRFNQKSRFVDIHKSENQDLTNEAEFFWNK